MSGEDVDDIDEPAGERAELLVAQTDAAVHHCPLGGGELPSELTGARRADAGDRLDAFRRPVGDERFHPVDAIEDLGTVDAHEVLGEQHLRDGEQERSVRAGRDRQPFVGPLRGPRATWVDHDHLTATFADAIDLAHHVGAREE